MPGSDYMKKEDVILEIIKMMGKCTLMDIVEEIEKMEKNDEKIAKLFSGCNIPQVVREMVERGMLREEGGGFKPKKFFVSD